MASVLFPDIDDAFNASSALAHVVRRAKHGVHADHFRDAFTRRNDRFSDRYPVSAAAKLHLLPVLSVVRVHRNAASTEEPALAPSGLHIHATSAGTKSGIKNTRFVLL